MADASAPGAEQALLRYRTLGATPHGDWLEIELETGRMHQIRLQAASRGHPVIGDELYGSLIPFGPPTDDPRLRPIALHARSLTFVHPQSQQSLTLVAQIPKSWQELGIVDSSVDS